MKELRLGEMVRHRREELNISQERLCEGLCEPGTLSRFETGRQTLSHKRAVAMLQRLGLPDDRFYALLSEDEIALEKAEREARSYCVRFTQAAEAERSLAWAQAEEKLKRLEALGPDDPFIRQCALSLWAVIGRKSGPYSNQERLSMLLEAIRLTVPRFDPAYVGLWMYSAAEIILIDQIATTYSRMGQHEDCLRIHRQTLEYLEVQGPRQSLYYRHVASVSYNYSRELCLVGRYQESLEIAQTCWRACIDSGLYHVLAYLLSLQAECHFQLGNLQKSAELYHQAHYVVKATGDEYYLRFLDAEARERLDITFSY